MDLVGKYNVKPFSKYRQLVVDLMEEGARRHHIPVWIEVDITLARNQIREYKKITGQSLSNTGWITKCVAQAVSESKDIQAFRHGNGKLVVFDDVDVWLAVEGLAGEERQIWPYVLRKVNEKSVSEIHDEIRQAQDRFVKKEGVPDDPSTARLRNPRYLPKIVRKLFWWRLRRDAILAKKVGGTVAVTAPTQGTRISQWRIPIGLHTLMITIGGIVKKPGVVGDQIEIREYLDLTVSFNHDVIDGAPVNAFVRRLGELLENAYGLESVTTAGFADVAPASSLKT